MIDILKKRHKIGDTVTIYTAESSFTGVIDAFEETCLILSTEEGDEFIANDTIRRISIPKTTVTDNDEVANHEKIVDDHQDCGTENESKLPLLEEKDKVRVVNNIESQKSDFPDKFKHLGLAPYKSDYLQIVKE